MNKKIFLISTVLILIILAIKFSGSTNTEIDMTPVYEVKEGPLTISVTSSGTVQSRDKIEIKSELEGKNTVIWVIDEGTRIKKDDLLLEFDASELEEKHKEQKVTVVNRESAYLVSKEQLEITHGDSEASLLNAEIDLKLSKMDLEKFNKGDSPKNISQYQSDIVLAEEELQRAEEKLTWSRKLFDAGYLTRTELQADELSAKRAVIKCDMSNMTMNVYTNYTVFKEEEMRNSEVRKAERTLIRTKFQNASRIRQNESEVISKELEYSRATNRLDELSFQISKSRITAPVDGIILYASSVQIARRMWWIQPLQAGGTANQQQDLIYIPLESGMVVEVMIPEASLNKLVIDMDVMIKIDAIPDRVFQGKLVKIGLLPDGQSAQLSPDLKLYKCEIEFGANDKLIRSGMSCDVELIRKTYDLVCAVPLQCVIKQGEQAYVYKMKDGIIEACEVVLGMDNQRMVHVIKGVTVGEKILLAPPIPDSNAHIPSETEKEKPARDKKRT